MCSRVSESDSDEVSDPANTHRIMADDLATESPQSWTDGTNSRNTKSANTAQQTSASWNWLGVLSLSTILACAVASAIVVRVSDGKEADRWKISPTVWLAIFSAGSSVAFSSALATGIAVRFWLHAARGTQMEQLHYIWDHGRGLGMLSALRAGSSARKVTLIATLAYIVQFASGPLLQRSVHQANRERLSKQTMFVNLADRIPDGWFGLKGNSGLTHGRRAMSQYQQWYLNSTIVQQDTEGYRCDGGTCLGYVRGAGFTYSCNSSTRPLDMSNNATAHLSTAFLIDAAVTVNGTGRPALQLVVSHIFKMEGNCQATINTTTCQVAAAVVEYPVVITNSTLALRHNLLETPLRPVSIEESQGDYLTAPNGSGAGPLSGLGKFVNDNFSSNDTIRFNNISNKWLYSGAGMGHLGDAFFQAEPWDYSNHSLATCGLIWASPTQYVITAMHDYMFRVSMRVGFGVERHSFLAEKRVSVLVFESDWRYLGAALAALLVGLLLVGSLSWGGWRLQRAVTLSPLETAALFVNHEPSGEGATELRGVLKLGSTIDQILAEARRMDVRVAESKKQEVTQVDSVEAAPSSSANTSD